MTADAIKCEVCGAVMVPQADGRTYECEYCKAQVLVAVDAGQLARGMALDLSNADAFINKLAQILSSTLAERTKLHHQGAHVASIEIDLSPDVFIAKRDGHGVTAQHKKIVRGIALKTTTHPLDQWVMLMSAALAKHANEDARASKALTHLMGKQQH